MVASPPHVRTVHATPARATVAAAAESAPITRVVPRRSVREIPAVSTMVPMEPTYSGRFEEELDADTRETDSGSYHYHDDVEQSSINTSRNDGTSGYLRRLSAQQVQRAVPPPGEVQEYDHLQPNLPCPLCGRKFMAEDRLQKHVGACSKVQKNRKVFDASKARVKGTELEQYVMRSKNEKGSISKSGGNSKTKVPLCTAVGAAWIASANRNGNHIKSAPSNDNVPLKPQKSSWRVKHENFIQMIRSNRASSPPLSPTKTSTRSAPTNPAFSPTASKTFQSQPDPDLVPCDSCGRRFNADTAERHIPFCKAAKQKQLHARTNTKTETVSGVGLSKDEMLRKRTAYRPPPPKTRSSGLR
ncbi:Zinc finger C2HC domain-containing protein 1C [Borealophlyctis nickersoniae]|nr:Zinc finger C2HC domain-containing protein 1C [Borealophlyctis nickersoniae]